MPRKLRPRLSDPGILDELCRRISHGKGIYRVCRAHDMPHKDEVYETMAIDAAVATAIARAREAQQEALVDDMRREADDATPETWQVARLRIWTTQWTAAKLLPKKYGTTKHEFGGPDGGPIPVNFDAMSEAQIANFIQRLERRDQGEGPGGGEGGTEPPEG